MKLNNDSFSEALSQRYDQFTHQRYYQMFPQSLLHYINENGGLQNKTIFDVGCGNGDLTSLLAKQGAASVLGMDISESQVAIASKNHTDDNVAFIVGDAYKQTAQPQGPFDIIACMYSFHFIKDQATLDEATKNLALNLKEGGLLVFLDITHDYKYDKAKMAQLRELTSFHYEPDIEEGETPPLWSLVPGFVTTGDEVIPVDHIAVHGAATKASLERAGFTDVEKKPFVFDDQEIVDFWGPDGFDHHIFVAKKG